MTRSLWLWVVIAMLVPVGASHAQGAASTRATLSVDERISGFVQLWSASKTNFVFEEKRPGLDWNVLLTEYLPLVRAEQSDRDYYRVLTRFIARLHDAHTLVAMPGFDFAVPIVPSYAPPLVVQQVEGKAVVVDLVESDEVRRAGVTRGMEITHVDGRSVSAALQDLDPYLCVSTPQARDAWVYPVLLDGPAGSRVALGVRDPHGEARTFTLLREPVTPPFAALLPKPALASLVEEQRGPQGEPYPWQSRPKREPRDLPGDILYVPVDSFFSNLSKPVVAQYDELADRVARAKALILDLRENGGGNSENADAIVSRLTDKPLLGSRWKTRRHLGAWAAWGQKDDWFDGGVKTIQPVEGQRPFLGPVVVLVGPRTLSAAEDFLIPLHASHRATLVGQRTAGSTGQPLIIMLPGGGGAAICTKWDSYPDGREFVGVGIDPDVEVYPTQAEVAAGLWSGGKDPVLERGVAVLREKLRGR
jgi:carboxyl-terminal processing protease